MLRLRRLLVPVLLAPALLGAPRPAHAELPGGGAIVFDRLLIKEDGDDLASPSTDEARDHYFNLAHCVCANANAGPEQTFSVEMRLEGATGQSDRPADIFFGSQCNDDVQRPTTCSREDAATIADIDELALGVYAPELKVSRLMAPLDATCSERVYEGQLWVLVDGDADGTYDYDTTFSVTTDSEPPPVPTDFEAAGAEAAVDLSWSAPTGRATDILYYQALCAGPDGLPAIAAEDRPTQRYQTVRGLCNLNVDVDLTGVSIVTDAAARPGPTPDAMLPDAMLPDAGVPPVVLPEELTQLDPTYLCGETTGAATSLRIEGLTNDVEYTVVLLSVDKYANAAGVYFTQPLVPQPVTDFWEDLGDRGSKVEGGFCLSVAGDDANAAGSLMLVALAGVLAWARRRRRTVVATVAVVMALPLAAGVARADDWDPYWTDDLDGTAADEPVRWNVGIKFGPYTPAIDAQFAGQTGADPDDGPYAQMFGGDTVLPTLDVDYFFAHPYGQLGVGGSIGFAGKTAKAFAAGSDPNDPDRPRADNDTTSFRVLPLAATLTYRFTWLDDAYGVPLVPYARAGLAYSIWWVRAPSGDFAESYPGGCDPADAGCDGNRALGGSLGLQGAIGLAVRAERIDADAAGSMAASGMEHAGFYAELQLAKVDGFGSEQRLAVGDNTWFAGVNFEF
ncbi:MAG: MXAN_2562 family outer membrane beta-barrel protein [Kofleriaceae bacterium]